MKITRIVDRTLEQFDNEDREWVIRWRLWLHEWFPHRLCELHGFDEETGELITGPWIWHPPRRWEKWRQKNAKGRE